MSGRTQVNKQCGRYLSCGRSHIARFPIIIISLYIIVLLILKYCPLISHQLNLHKVIYLINTVYEHITYLKVRKNSQTKRGFTGLV